MPLIYKGSKPDVGVKILNKIYYLHKEVITDSVYIRNLLMSKKYNSESVLNLECDEADELLILKIIDLLYDGNIQIRNQDVEKMWLSANILGIEKLKKKCIEYCTQNLRNDRFFASFLNISLNNHDNYKKCLETIKSNVKIAEEKIGDMPQNLKVDVTSLYTKNIFKFDCQLLRFYSISAICDKLMKNHNISKDDLTLDFSKNAIIRDDKTIVQSLLNSIEYDLLMPEHYKKYLSEKNMMILEDISRMKEKKFNETGSIENVIMLKHFYNPDNNKCSERVMYGMKFGINIINETNNSQGVYLMCATDQPIDLTFNILLLENDTKIKKVFASNQTLRFQGIKLWGARKFLPIKKYETINLSIIIEVYEAKKINK